MESLFDEIESLEAILMDDVRISRNIETGVPEVIETTIFPVFENDSESHICVNLQVFPSEGYPDVSPTFSLLKPRGLDDHRLDAIRLACVNKLRENQGFPVVFDLIEVVREHLSNSKLPCGQCVICLYGFREEDEFTKTECYHYLHSYCLARHLIASRNNYEDEQAKLPAWIRKASDPFKATCPVCRESIKDDSESLKNCLPPTELINAPDFHLTDELVHLQQKMASLFIHQKKRGGIIDADADIGPVISIEPSDGNTEEQCKFASNEPRNYFKDDRPLSIQSTNKKSGCSGESSVRTVKCGQGGRSTNNASDFSKEANSSTNFAPVVTQSQRIASDPTNNNYHHNYNRRHMRGRRHHHNRSENYGNHSSSQSRPPLPTEPTAAQANTGKQSKGLANLSGNSR